MIIGINCGHTICGGGGGANGVIMEAIHTRLIGYSLMKNLRDAGFSVIDCTIDEAETQQQYLQKVVALANTKDLDLFISIHFNASKRHTGQGVEVYTYGGQKHSEAVSVCENIARLGFVNRGIKDGSSLYIIRKTKAKSMLIEVCFCDNQQDVGIYNRIGAENTIAQAIFTAISKGVSQPETEKSYSNENSFEEFVGKIARDDWEKRRIMLPSVVVAQAIKESARGTSELAQKANALFGIKKNGWTGAVYTKTATEQAQDGSYYSVDNIQWRAYDNWEQSILDHNSYIATRSTDGGKTLRYAPIIGCESYILVCQYLQECGYATSHTYAESLINDYIEKYNLQRFDEL